MEWVLRSPQIHTTFGNLGFALGDGYHINKNCNDALETILHNILSEDKYLRTYRKSISFGQNINKDLVPLLLHAKEDKTIELIIKILVNLTIPIECLLSVEVISKSEFGRHTIFEMNNLLSTAKAAFTDQKASKVIIEFLKKNLEGEQKGLTVEQCTQISNSLLLLRNILHIPVESNTGYNNLHTVQNQILWNIFSQSIDKILIKLMVIPEAPNWAVTMVQLIALLYKDQHVVTLHKLINLWLETSLSESSEDNESNTSPPDRGSEDSSPMLTSDPTSDSSDTGGSGKNNHDPSSLTNKWDASLMNSTSGVGNQPFQSLQHASKQHQALQKSDFLGTSVDETKKSDEDDKNLRPEDTAALKHRKNILISENSDCGYGTQIENQESISTSSNEDELSPKKPMHQKPHNPKQRVNPKVRTGISSLQEKKRKKLVKRGKTNIINVRGLSHSTPTDDDISNILKEFTVDFLLKGYNHLVHTLHTQMLINMQLEIDISHFFWLVTYFLKFATQIELDLEHIRTVLSYDVISYLTSEGVNLCEQFELAIKMEGNDLKPSIRRLHLVVTAIREFVQAVEAYQKFVHICKDDQNALFTLQVKMCETEELRSLLVLLLRTYNPKYHSKQYLQDLVVTNHILLIFLDSVMKMPDYHGSANMTDHIKQFATPEIMYQYGLLLEDYTSNGQFVNDCIFTLMHHVGGELRCLIALFQPKILKTFTSIWKSEFDICDDWSDLIEHVMNTFIKKPHILPCSSDVFMEDKSFEEDSKFFSKHPSTHSLMQMETEDLEPKDDKKKDITCGNTVRSDSFKDRWTEDELSCLSWNFMQCSASPDVVGAIINLFKDDGITKSRDSIIHELYKQKLINKKEFETASKSESERMAKNFETPEYMHDTEIKNLCEQMTEDGKFKFLDWVQKVLLDTCHAKIYLEKNIVKCKETVYKNQIKLLTFELFKEKAMDMSIISPVSYHSLIYNQSVPLVPWNCEQAAICKDLKFLQLLHKLGCHMPVDTGKVFIRIPHFWTADCLYEIANKVAPIDTSKLKFSLTDLTLKSRTTISSQRDNFILSPSPALIKDVTMIPGADTLYEIHKQKHLAIMNYTPMPGSSFYSEADEVDKQNWLQLVQNSQDYKIGLTLKSLSKTASVASDLTRMYVSDEDDKTEVLSVQPLENQDYVMVDDIDQASIDINKIAAK